MLINKYSLMLLFFNPVIFFAAGVLIQHREIVKNKSKRLKIIAVSVIFALAFMMIGYTSYYKIITDLLPLACDSIELFFLLMTGGYYALVLDIIFILGCLARWAVYRVKNVKVKR